MAHETLDRFFCDYISLSGNKIQVRVICKLTCCKSWVTVK